MRARSLFLWTPLVLLAALAIPGTALADGYHVNLTTNSCASTGHTVTLAFKAIADAGTFADEVTISFQRWVKRNGSWHLQSAVASAEPIEPNSQDRQAFPASYTMTNANHKVRLKAAVMFRQSGLTAWDWHFTSVAC